MSEIEFLTGPPEPDGAADLQRRLLAVNRRLPRPQDWTADEAAVRRRFATGEYPQSAIGYVMARAWFGRN